jgi:hypothetical protein
LDTLNKHH